MKMKHWAGVAAATAIIASFTTQAAEVNLRFAHPWPATSAIHEGLEDWRKSLTEASDGRIEVDMYPSQTLVKSASSYDAVKSGITDVTATVQGYTANRFPLTQIIELPGMVDSAAQGSCALQSLYDSGVLNDEYDDSHVLFVYTNGPGHIHTRDKKVTGPEDIRGLVLRRPTTVVGAMMEDLGAQPVGMPAPDIYQSLQRGLISGVAISWDGAKVFRINELTNYHTELNLYSLSFVVTMNKDVYQRLPDDLKTIVDEHSGTYWSQHMAAVFDDLDKQARAEALENGDTVIDFDEDVRKAWKPALDKVTEEYLISLEADGLPARDIYQRARSLSESCREI
jgi:TRAP-type C4-dicarboxylate transport system substrate-binding protein